MATTFYHIGFGPDDLTDRAPTIALLSGDPDRAKLIAESAFSDVRMLSEHRGLNSYLGTLPNGRAILSCTSGMGAPSLSIVVNELVQAGVRQIIRIGTCGSIQEHVLPGSVVISRAALCRQGAANDIAPLEYPAAADPFLTWRWPKPRSSWASTTTWASLPRSIPFTKGRNAANRPTRTCCAGCAASPRSTAT